ncbi:MAG: SIS domain-containing protein [Propionicimonas sp.]
MTGPDRTIELILDEIRAGLSGLDQAARARFVALLGERNRVFVVGVGRVRLALEAFAKRLNHLGVPAHVVGENSEPPLAPGDLLVVGSGSGSSLIPLAIAQKARSLGGTVVHVGARADSPMAPVAELTICLRTGNKTDRTAVASRQPMTSLFEQALWIYLDSICLELWEKLTPEQQRVATDNHANLE